MPVHNADIAAAFENIADLLEIQGANPFRIRAYRNAARTFSELSHEARELLAAGADLTRLPGIGDDLAGKVRELVDTGHCGLLDRLRKELPPAVTELLRIPGLGPKRVRTLWHDLGVQTVEQLVHAAAAGRIHQLHGFGEKTERSILEAVRAQADQERRILYSVAAQYAESLRAALASVPGVDQVTVAGSFRRRCETVGDLDLLVSASDPATVMRRFTTYDEVADILSAGDTRGSILLKSGLQVDLRVVATEYYGSALHYFTGSKAHNIAIRRLGQKQGLKINEYGVFRGRSRIAGTTEASVYEAVGLPYIPPELRENRGEIEQAQSGQLPRLVARTDLRGDLHAHTRDSDGRDTLEAMAKAAQAQGLSYLAITDHSAYLGVTHGLDAARLRSQGQAIDRLNATFTGFTLLKGVEVDILEDGRLALPDTVLSQLDVVIASVHSHFDLPRARQTERLLRTLDHPHITLLGHPSGRLLGERAPYDVDMERVIRKAGERGCFLELNSQPQRLDLNDLHCRMARDAGVLVSVNSDAHSAFDLANLELGIGQARRGWLEKRHVLNTRPIGSLRDMLGITP
ncbi:MAG: DNA polymerase/3'-5' exonuclease PolX [Betaproteobacteria bacterium]|nr:DNA polymerase/3'-5' exonuclease PolX [Betaproteobacteria bacterium]MDE2131486.1 DNA polymerase/3'-5' exonuclease PolX [Betaproteobacteria bacterium]MDE2211527.1 DNA polymerase/3'-5' exonuclease PolX [Betaproteobacteria bacterium]